MKIRLVLMSVLLLLMVFVGAKAEHAQLTASSIITDGNAMVIAFEAVGSTQEENLYGTLNTVYVNGLEAPIAKSSANTFGFLNTPQAFSVTLDISNLPRADQYTVVTTYSILRPNAAIEVVDGKMTDAYYSYIQNVTALNDQGYIVATPDGEILLAEGTYSENWLLSGQLVETGKMSEIETLSFVQDVPLSDIEVLEGAGSLDIDNWTLRVRKAEASSLSVTLIIDEIFPQEMSYVDVTAAMRHILVTDAGGSKAFYTGNTKDLSDPKRQSDGTWLATFTWNSQSIVIVPKQLRLTPYTLDANMTPVEEVGHELILTLQ